MTENNGLLVQYDEAAENITKALASFGKLVDGIAAKAAPTMKQQFIQALQINDTVIDLLAMPLQIAEGAQAKTRYTDEAQTLKKRIEEIKAMLMIGGSIDGKNAEIREAQLLVALKEDPEYQAVSAQLYEAEKKTTEWDMELERLRGMQTALEIKARLTSAQLEYLAE